MSETKLLHVFEAGEFCEGVPEGGRLVIFLAHDRTPRTLAVGCLVRTVAPGGEAVRAELVQLLAHSNGVRTCIEFHGGREGFDAAPVTGRFVHQCVTIDLERAAVHGEVKSVRAL